MRRVDLAQRFQVEAAFSGPDQRAASFKDRQKSVCFVRLKSQFDQAIHHNKLSAVSLQLSAVCFNILIIMAVSCKPLAFILLQKIYLHHIVYPDTQKFGGAAHINGNLEVVGIENTKRFADRRVVIIMGKPGNGVVAFER